MTNSAKKLKNLEIDTVLLSTVIQKTVSEENKIGIFRKIISALSPLSSAKSELNFEKWERLESKPRRSPSHHGRGI